MFGRRRRLPPGYTWRVTELKTDPARDWFDMTLDQLEVLHGTRKVATELMPFGTGRLVRRRLIRAAWLDYDGRRR